MRGILILVVFFSMFTFASLLIPTPMFPGTFFAALIGQGTGEYAEFLSAVFNGIFYGIILWLVFLVMSKRLEGEK
jgi:hypothetical protein